MKKRNEDLEKILLRKYGKIKGAGVLLAKDLGISQPGASMIIAGKRGLGPDLVKILAEKWGDTEDNIDNLFNRERKAALKKIKKVVIDIPTLGIIKDKEVIFVPSTSIPKKEDVAMKMEFDLEVTDDKLPPYKKKEMVHFVSVDSIKGYEGRRFIVKNSDDTYYMAKLDKPSKHEVVAVVLGRYIPEE